MENYSGGKLLGKGSSSCVFTPEFPCKNTRKKKAGVRHIVYSAARGGGGRWGSGEVARLWRSTGGADIYVTV